MFKLCCSGVQRKRYLLLWIKVPEQVWHTPRKQSTSHNLNYDVTQFQKLLARRVNFCPAHFLSAVEMQSVAVIRIWCLALGRKKFDYPFSFLWRRRSSFEVSSTFLREERNWSESRWSKLHLLNEGTRIEGQLLKFNKLSLNLRSLGAGFKSKGYLL